MNVKLDLNKPYGTVVGHPIARYEQDGHLYDPRGDIIGYKADGDPFSLPAMIASGERAPDSLENAKAFLTRILEGGPVPKSIVYREAEQNNQSWAEVTQAFGVMGIQVLKGPAKGSPSMWKLPETTNV